MIDDREESRAQPSHRYGDPLEVLIRDESRSCHGCVYEVRILGRAICDRDERYGKRCKHYVERRPLGR